MNIVTSNSNTNYSYQNSLTKRRAEKKQTQDVCEDNSSVTTLSDISPSPDHKTKKNNNNRFYNYFNQIPAAAKNGQISQPIAEHVAPSTTGSGYPSRSQEAKSNAAAHKK